MTRILLTRNKYMIYCSSWVKVVSNSSLPFLYSNTGQHLYWSFATMRRRMIEQQLSVLTSLPLGRRNFILLKSGFSLHSYVSYQLLSVSVLPIFPLFFGSFGRIISLSLLFADFFCRLPTLVDSHIGN